MSAPVSSAGASAGADNAAAAAAAAATAAAAAAAASSSGSKRSFPGAAASSHDDRRVQPRHFHAGPNAAAASASSSSSSAEEAEGPPPAARLYRHALESIFAFLKRGELVTALQVSRGWLAAANSMAGLELLVERPSAPLAVLSQSAMGRHVSALGDDSYSLSSPLTLRIAELRLLAQRMAHLRRLEFKLLLPLPAHAPQSPLAFPSGLRHLHLRVPYSAAPADVNAVIVAVARLPLLESFTLRLPSVDRQISFAPLAAMPHLRALNIIGEEEKFTDAQVSELRALPRLHRISVGRCSAALLRRLLRPPHSLQWQRIATPDLDDEVAALLPQLPSLTQGDWDVTCMHFEWLAGLPHLTSMSFGFKEDYQPDHMQLLLAALRRCPQLRSLTWSGCIGLTSAHLADLLPHLPQLHTLELHSLDIDSLAFLAHLPTASQLTSLSVVYCPQLPLTDLRCLHPLRGLTSLELFRSLREPLDRFSQSLFEPPSLFLPQLQRFDYMAPEQVE